jgi:hypothetical protein
MLKPSPERAWRRRRDMSNIRWRLIMGLLSLAAALVLTAPAAASGAGRAVGEIWPNGPGVADIIWPNAAPIAEIWPNGAVFDDPSGI